MHSLRSMNGQSAVTEWVMLAQRMDTSGCIPTPFRLTWQACELNGTALCPATDHRVGSNKAPNNRIGRIVGPTLGAGMPHIRVSSSASTITPASMSRRLEPVHRCLGPWMPWRFPAAAAGNDTNSPTVLGAPHAPRRCLGGSCG